MELKKCLICNKEFNAQYKSLTCSKECNKKRHNQTSLKYYHNHKQKYDKRNCLKCGKEFIVNRKDKMFCSKNCRESLRQNNKRKNNKSFLISNRLRVTIWQMIKTGNIPKNNKYNLDLNGIYDKLKNKLSQKYVLDHIIPVDFFDLTDKEDVKKCFSPLNMRYISKKENFIKGSKININLYPEQQKVAEQLKINLNKLA